MSNKGTLQSHPLIVFLLRSVGFRTSTISEHAENAKNLHLECLKIKCQILKILLLWRAVLTPFVKAARSAASFMDGCVAAVQVEEFGLPKSGVSTARQRSNFFRIWHLIFKHSSQGDFEICRLFGASGNLNRTQTGH